MKTFPRTEVAWRLWNHHHHHHQPEHDLIPQARPLFHQDLYSFAAALGVGPTTVSDDQSPSRSAFLVTASAVGSGAASGAGHAARAVASVAKPMGRALGFPLPSVARGSNNSPLCNNSFLLLMFPSAKEIMPGGWQQQRRKTKDEGCEIWNLRKKIEGVIWEFY
ncbi:uncharacterized protein DS421_9g272960 [Arachis hypogaea]|nr:uncharacterized protein DS421_9g272960 [Arachis hypogaea]